MSRRGAGEGEADVPLHAAGLPAGANAGNHSSQIDRRETRARQLGVQPRRFGNVGDEPIQPVDVVAHHFQKLGPQPRVLHPLQRFYRRSERSERVFQLVGHRSEEHTSELQSLMRISYAVFCLKKKKNETINDTHTRTPTTKLILKLREPTE